MNERRTINVAKKFFDSIKTYCDDNGLKMHYFMTAAAINEIARRQSHLDPLFIKADDGEINIKLFELFYKTLNVSSNLKTWIQDIMEKGNSYVKLNTSMEQGIISCENCREMNRIEGTEKTTKVMFCCGDKILENYEVLHFRHLASGDCLPYGIAIELKKDIFSTQTSTSNNRTIIRLSRIVESELSKAAIVHLYALGYRDDNLVNFTLKVDDDFVKTAINDYCSEIKNEYK